MTVSEKRPVVLYDGQCPVCKREINLYQRIDRDGAVEWRDLHAPGALEGTGLSWEQAMKRFHCLDVDGRLRGGVDAFTLVWSYLPYWRWLAYIVRGLGLKRLLEPLYIQFAKRRYRRRCNPEHGCAGPPQ